MPVQINQDLCQQCSSCIEVCPEEVLQEVNGKTMVVNVDDCIDCLACMDECPDEAISEIE